MRNVPLFRAIAAIWLMGVVIATLVAATDDVQLDSSIMAMLPKSERSEILEHSNDRLVNTLSDNLTILVSGDNEALARESVTKLARALDSLPETDSVTWRADAADFNAAFQYAFTYRFHVLPPDLRSQLQNGELSHLTQRAVQQFFSPIKQHAGSLVDDPFGFSADAGLAHTQDLNISISDGLLKLSKTEIPTFLINARIGGDVFSLPVQNSILSVVGEHQLMFASSGVTLSMSGLILHAAAGAEQGIREVSTIGIGSLIGIVVAVLVVFRRTRSLLMLLIPVGIGCIAATAATVLLFDRIHLITFTFGAGLIGVSIDYALHFLCERRISSASETLYKILPGLSLGLFSSLIAYGALALAPFPGLRQVAVFSVVGLLTSWAAVVYLFPALTRREQEKPVLFADSLYRFIEKFPTVSGTGGRAMIVIPAVLAGVFCWDSNSADDITLLQTSSATLIAEDNEVRSLLNAQVGSKYLLLVADNVETALQRQEEVTETLDSWINQGGLTGYQATSQSLPSKQRQTENIQLVDTLYRSELKTFFATLGLGEKQLDAATKAFQTSTNSLLSIETWRSQQSNDSLKPLLYEDNDNVVAIIRFSGRLEQATERQLIELADNHHDLHYVDQVTDISNVLSRFREQISLWLALAYSGVFFILFLRYRNNVWRIALPPALASLFTLGTLAVLTPGINLFHIMALILVLGISLDMGIFLTETQYLPQTWLAVSLSSYSSLLAFGLLALSETPVLHHFGLTVLFGLTFAWLLVVMTRTKTIEL